MMDCVSETAARSTLSQITAEREAVCIMVVNPYRPDCLGIQSESRWNIYHHIFLDRHSFDFEKVIFLSFLLSFYIWLCRYCFSMLIVDTMLN